MEPNDFFGGGINESSLLSGMEHDDNDTRSRVHSFNETNNHLRSMSEQYADEESEEVFDPMLNVVKPNFVTRMRMYLNPHDGSISLQFLLLVSDTILALIYITAQLNYVLKGTYDDEQDKLV